MFESFFTWLSEKVHNIVESLLSVLPDSPFIYLTQNSSVAQYIRYINWIVPVNFMLSVMQAWLVAITLYYVWSLVLRWIKAID